MRSKNLFFALHPFWFESAEKANTRVSFTTSLWDSLLISRFYWGGILTVNLANDFNPAEEENASEAMYILMNGFRNWLQLDIARYEGMCNHFLL